MKPHRMCALTLVLLGAIAACDRNEPPAPPAPADAAGATPTATAKPAEPVELVDVMEANADYVVGITYPQSATRYPALAAELKRYAEAARSDLMRAVKARQQRESPGEGSEGATLYDLSLAFTEVFDSPDLVAYAADGSSYTGGAHGIPLLARFVWLPREDRQLTAQALVPQPSGWQAIATHVREQLYTALSQRVEADDLPPAQRTEVVKGASRMIDDGTKPDPDNFAQFEPVVGDGNKVTGLRFVFAPYQVGPYSDGTQTVEVPASVLLPHVAPAYRALFTVVGEAPAG